MAGARHRPRTKDQWRPVTANKDASSSKSNSDLARGRRAASPARRASQDRVRPSRESPSRSPLRTDHLHQPRQRRRLSPSYPRSTRRPASPSPPFDLTHHNRRGRRRDSLNRQPQDPRPPPDPSQRPRPSDIYPPLSDFSRRPTSPAYRPKKSQPLSFSQSPPRRPSRRPYDSSQPDSPRRQELPRRQQSHRSRSKSRSRSPAFESRKRPRSPAARSQSPRSKLPRHPASASRRLEHPRRSDSRSPPRKKLSKKERKRRAQARKAEDSHRRSRDEREMSYPPYDAPYGGRGGSMRGRGGPPSHYGHNSPAYGPPTHSASPYSASGQPGWGPDPYAHQHSPAGYGYPAPSPYQYPPAPSPHHGYSPGPPPPQAYNPPPLSHQGYSPPPFSGGYERRSSYDARPPYERRGRGGYPQPSDRRHSSTSSQESYDSRGNFEGGGGRGNRRGGRGHFTNISWTPKDGRRGGHHVASKRERESTTGADEQRPDQEENEAAQDDLFRPPQDFRSEDQASRDARAMPPPAQGSRPPEAESKIGTRPNNMNSSTMPLVASTSVEDPMGASSKSKIQSIQEKLNRSLAAKTGIETPKKPPPAKREVKTWKYRKELSEEHQKSTSVYFRKPGNESVVGSGTYGKVYRAVHVYTKEQVALKKIRMEGERDGFPTTAMRELRILQILRHDNVVKVHEIMVENHECYMVFEYLSHDLTGLLNHPTFRLNDGHKKNLARQLMCGLEYMHAKSVLHRDLKAANILISSTGVLKLADFGLARTYDKRRQNDYTNRVVTIWYRSPELLWGETQYGPAVDIWSAACVLVEIFTRHSIFPGEGGEIKQLEKIYTVMGTPTKTDWPDLVELPWIALMAPPARIPSTFAAKYAEKMTPEAFSLLQQMLSYDPKNRPSAEEILAHSYFTEEEPAIEPLTELQNIEGEWHEFESKKLRKEGEERRRQEEKRKRQEAEDAEKETTEEKEAKKQKLDSSVGPTPSNPLGSV